MDYVHECRFLTIYIMTLGEYRLMAHFAYKYSGKNMCFGCYQDLGTNIGATVAKLENLTSKIKQEFWSINQRRLQNLQRSINLHKNLDLVVAEYALDL
jgi:TATA-box binding protein (TBP) (component of TFIID and TFIIIB)